MKFMPAAAVALTALSVSACSMLASKPTVADASIPASLRVPAGQFVKYRYAASGDVTYQCLPASDRPGQFAWVQMLANATLNTRSGRSVGRYYGGPTWEANDGSQVVGSVVASVDSTTSGLPQQLIQTVASEGKASFSGISYIQLLNTQGGGSPSATCDYSARTQRQQVGFQADFVFYSAPHEEYVEPSAPSSDGKGLL